MNFVEFNCDIKDKKYDKMFGCDSEIFLFAGCVVTVNIGAFSDKNFECKNDREIENRLNDVVK
jgi:hypothetical protein